MKIYNLPVGAVVFATLTALPGSSSPTSKARLIVTDALGAGAFHAAKTSAVGVCEDESRSVSLLPAEAGSAQAVWEVTGSDPNELETFSFGLMVAYESKPEINQPAPGTTMAIASYAPTSTDGRPSASAPIPRFSQSAAASRNLFSIQLPTTRLLFPDVLNQAGFDTGIRIANESAVPGNCTLRFATSGGGVSPPPQVSSMVAKGYPISLTLSSVAPGFRGCILATCRFKSAIGEYGTWPMGSNDARLLPAAILTGITDPKTINRQCDF